MTDILLSANNLTKSFVNGRNSIIVLHGIHLEVNSGDFISIMGPSGCGKSTLLNLLGGLDAPTSGEVIFNGKNLASLDEKARSLIRCRDIGFVFQFYNLIENLTVEENILLPLLMSGEKASKHKDEINDILRKLNLTDKRKSFPTELSGGEQQRTAIARAIINKPKIILADEPTGNLDSENGKQVMELFRTIHEEYGITLVIVTHSKEVADMATRKITMSDGQIISDSQNQ